MTLLRLSMAAMISGATSLAGAVSAQTVDVQQYWTSASESRAMNIIADAFKARGGTWIDSPSADADTTIAAATSRIAGGEPPSAVLMTPGGAMRDMAASGLLRPLDDLARQQGWDSAISPLIRERLVVDGHMVAVPVGAHADNWIWYSKPVFADLGLSEPKTLDEMFAAADKIQAAGLVPFAIGGEPWQEAYILGDMIVSLGGPDYWNQLMVARDPAAFESPILVQAFALLRRVSAYADPGSPGRSWNDATGMLITGKAGMQFMGDWAKGEFHAAGQTAGRDFGCFLVPTDKPSYIVVTDIFAFPLDATPDRIAGQALLAETVLDPQVQVQVAAVKGSVPARTDVDTKGLDSCAVTGLGLLATPGVAVPSTYDALPGDLNGQFADIVGQFWTDPGMSPEDGVAALRAAFESQ